MRLRATLSTASGDVVVPVRVPLPGPSGWLGRCLAPRLRLAGPAVVGLDVVPGQLQVLRGGLAGASLTQ